MQRWVNHDESRTWCVTRHMESCYQVSYRYLKGQPRKVRKTYVTDRKNNRQIECKHIVLSEFNFGGLTTWSDVKKALESSRIIFSSGNTWKSDMKKSLFVATVPGSFQVNRCCVATKERSGRIQLPLKWMWENIHCEKPLRRPYECTLRLQSVFLRPL